MVEEEHPDHAGEQATSSIVTIPVVQQKGGVGKTTTAANLAAALAREGYRTLVADLDPQQTLTTAMLGRRMHEQYPGIAEVLGYGNSRSDPTEVARQVIAHSANFDCDVLAASYEPLSAQKNALQSNPGLAVRLLQVAEGLSADYDVMIVDCPPNLEALTTTAIYAADAILVVLEPAEESTEGLGTLLRVIEAQRRLVGRDIPLAGACITKYVANRRWPVETEDALNALGVFPWVQHITAAERIRDAFRARAPLRTIARSDNEREAVADFRRLAKLIADLVEQSRATS